MKNFEKFEILNKVSPSERRNIEGILKKLSKIKSFRKETTFYIDHYIIFSDDDSYGLEDCSVKENVLSDRFIPDEIKHSLNSLYSQMHNWCVRNLPKLKSKNIKSVADIKECLCVISRDYN